MYEQYKDFKANTVYLIHDGYASYPYGFGMILKGRPKLLTYSDSTIEGLLLQNLDVDFTDEDYLNARSLSLNELSYLRLTNLYEAPAEGLREKLKMQAILELPLADALTKLSEDPING